MSYSSLRLQPLSEEHDLSGFDSGKAALDGWLKSHALTAQRTDSARTFVLLDGGDVVGYFSLTMGSVRRDDPPARLMRGMPRYPVGMVLLARLAVSLSHQGSGLGADLLGEATRRATAAAEHAAAHLVVVDAIDESAASFYRRWGFVSTPADPLRLYRRVGDIRRSMAEGDRRSAPTSSLPPETPPA